MTKQDYENIVKTNIYTNDESKVSGDLLQQVIISGLSVDTTLLTETTYSELKALRDASGLTPGMFYRITDYQCTTTQDDTQSAGHQFDIIVLATDTSTLNENAFAMKHDGDTYFANCDLNAWELKYSLDNDTDKFAWADSTNGKGVIFYMKDEWNNECPYDFKNIQFKRYKITEVDAYYKKNASVNYAWQNISGITGEDPEMIGGYGLGCVGIKVDTSDSKFFYTFSAYEDDSAIDDSLIPYCNSNKIGIYTDEGIMKLSNNVLCNKDGQDSDSFYGNTFGANCYNNTVWGYSFYANTFGNECYSNTFGNECYSNTFGNNCGGNTFGNECYDNSFGNYFQNNTFGNGCQYNSFGNSCYRSSFGNDCYWNTFGNGCWSNSFGNYCGGNTFGNGCWGNSFGNYCYYNSFGNSCYCSSFGNYMFWCTFEDGVRFVTTSCSVGDTAYLQYMHVLNGTQSVTITITASRTYCTFVGKISSINN